MSSVLLAGTLITAPAHAEPGTPPGNGGSSDEAPGRTGDAPPAPDHANAPDSVGARNDGPPPQAGDPDPQGPPAGVPQGPPAGVPQGPPAGVPQGPPAGVPQGPPAGVPAGPDEPKGPPAAAPGAKGQKVVVCKYVRKPGEAEVFSHVIVVNENALLGKGFAGTFPFPFSDAHFNSVAIRFAEKGESAKEVGDAGCMTEVPPPPPPPGGEPGGETGGETGGVGGVSEERAVAGEVAVAQDSVLPATGAPADLRALALLGGLGSLAGAWLVVRGRRKSHALT